MIDLSIPYYSGEKLPKDFQDWLDTLPKGYNWQSNNLGKNQSTYTFYKVNTND